jgi:membrane protein
MDLATARERFDRSLAGEIADTLVRIELIDRSLALASKLFVAVIPLSIILSATVPGSDGFAENLISRFSLTGPGAAATRDLFASNGAVRTGVSFIGLIILVYSVFSFTRGLQKVYADIWLLPPLKFEAIIRRATWLLGFIAYLIVLTPIQHFDEDHKIPYLYAIASLVLGAGFWLWTPYVLLGRRIPWRRLLPTGIITAAGISIYTIGSAIYLPPAMTHNAVRYGTIGIAFGLVTWLFAYAGVVIVCAVVGQSWDVHHNPETSQSKRAAAARNIVR